MTPITVYGTDWCEDTQRAREILDDIGVPYDYVNIERDPKAAAWVKQQNSGKQKTPTIKMQGLVLSEPSDEQLEDALRAEGLVS